MDLTEGELKGDGLVSNFSVNHRGFKQCTKKNKILNFVRIHLDTFKGYFSNINSILEKKKSLLPKPIKVCVH